MMYGSRLNRPDLINLISRERLDILKDLGDDKVCLGTYATVVCKYKDRPRKRVAKFFWEIELEESNGGKKLNAYQSSVAGLGAKKEIQKQRSDYRPLKVKVESREGAEGDDRLRTIYEREDDIECARRHIAYQAGKDRTSKGSEVTDATKTAAEEARARKVELDFCATLGDLLD